MQGMTPQRTRHERILFKLAEQKGFENWAYTQQMRYPDGWRRMVARKLASHSVLLAVADEFTPDMLADQEDAITEWIKGYAKLHELLAGSLFPSMKSFRAQYADGKMPPIVTLTAEPAPVAVVIAGFVMPYLTIRQPQRHLWSELELRGLIDTLLDELEADDLNRFQQDEIRRKGVAILARMLNTRVRHLSLTGFDRQILPAQATQNPTPSEGNPPPRPKTLPETGALSADMLPNGDNHDLPPVPDSDGDSRISPTQDMFRREIPLHGKTDRLPPIPSLRDRQPPIPPLRDRLKRNRDDEDNGR